MQASTVPVTRLECVSNELTSILLCVLKTYNWLGLDRDLCAELLGNTVEQEPSKPEVVAAALSARVLSNIFKAGKQSCFIDDGPEKQCSEIDLPHLNALTWANLELPLGGHDLGVGSRDLDTGVKAAPVVRLHDVTLDNLLQRTSAHCS